MRKHPVCLQAIRNGSRSKHKCHGTRFHLASPSLRNTSALCVNAFNDTVTRPSSTPEAIREW